MRNTKMSTHYRAYCLICASLACSQVKPVPLSCWGLRNKRDTWWTHQYCPWQSQRNSLGEQGSWLDLLFSRLSCGSKSGMWYVKKPTFLEMTAVLKWSSFPDLPLSHCSRSLARWWLRCVYSEPAADPQLCPLSLSGGGRAAPMEEKGQLKCEAPKPGGPQGTSWTTCWQTLLPYIRNKIDWIPFLSFEFQHVALNNVMQENY